jgi:diacylglycerol kinase (ATP)
MANSVARSFPISSLLPLVVFVNPAAGGRRARNFLPQVQKVFEEASVAAEYVFAQSSLDLQSAAHDAIKNGKRLLLSFGGDGTFHALVNVACGADVVVGVLPAGGGNDFAAALQMKDDPARVAAALMNGEPKWVDIVRAHTADGREHFYVGGGGLGIDAEAAHYAGGAFRHLPGRSRYIASALRAFCGFRPITVCAEFPESRSALVESKCLLAAVLNTPTFGAGIRLAPEAKTDDGWLDAVFVKDLNIFEVLGALPRLMKTGELCPRYVEHVRTKSVRLATDRPCLFHGDGEILGVTPVEIEVVPRALRVLAPTEL